MFVHSEVFRFFRMYFHFLIFCLTWTFGRMLTLITIFSNYSPISWRPGLVMQKTIFLRENKRVYIDKYLVNSNKKGASWAYLLVSWAHTYTLLVSWLPKSINDPSYFFLFSQPQLICLWHYMYMPWYHVYYEDIQHIYIKVIHYKKKKKTNNR